MQIWCNTGNQIAKANNNLLEKQNIIGVYDDISYCLFYLINEYAYETTPEESINVSIKSNHVIKYRDKDHWKTNSQGQFNNLLGKKIYITPIHSIEMLSEENGQFIRENLKKNVPI